MSQAKPVPVQISPPDWLKRLARGEVSARDQEELRQAVESGRLVLAQGAIPAPGAQVVVAEGERSVSAGGPITDSTVITGDVLFIELTPEALALLLALLAQASPPEPAPAGELLPAEGPPPGSRLPFGRNPAFIGREADMQALAQGLLSPAPGERVPPVVLTGPGGVGKTQLAVEFCCRYGRSFAGVHWIQCTPGRERETVLKGLAACGAKLKIQPWPLELEEQADFTLDELNRPGARPRLVVIDDLDQPARVGRWLARLQGVRLLLTARALRWPTDLPAAREHRLGPLARAESVRLLRQLAPSLGGSSAEEVDRLAAEHADLPALLAGAAGVLGYSVATLADYLEQMAGYLQAQCDPDTALRRLQWNALPNETARLALVAIALFGGQHGAGRELLALCLGIPSESQGDSAQPLDEALRPLLELRLAGRLVDGELYLHSQVSAFVARQLPPGSLNSAGERLRTHLLAALEGGPGRRAAALRIAEGLLALPFSPVRWEASALRTAVLRVLVRLMKDPHAPIETRRYAALLLTRLDWLRDLPALPPAEALEYLELAGRFVETGRERRYLAERVITPFLALPADALADGPRARFLVFRAAMWMQLRCREEAEQDYGIAAALLADLSYSGARLAEDDRTEARVKLGLGKLEIGSAFRRASDGDPSEPAAGLAQAGEYFELAVQFALRYRDDPVLDANIRMEMAFLEDMQGETRRALELCEDAKTALEERADWARKKDSEAFVVCKAHLLETSSMLHYNLGKSEARCSREGLAEYHAAYRQVVEELELLKAEDLRLTDNQVYALFNAGDYLRPMFRCRKSPVPRPREKALAHWQAGRDLALRLGLKGLARRLERRLLRYGPAA